MKKAVYILTLICLVFLFLLLGFFWGSNRRSEPIQVTVYDEYSSPVSSTVSAIKIDINTAGLNELKSIPGISRETARILIDYRRIFGNFRSTEELWNVEGISKEEVRILLDHITLGG